MEFPDGEALAERLRGHGLTDVRWHPLTFGIATLYVGTKGPRRADVSGRRDRGVVQMADSSGARLSLGIADPRGGSSPSVVVLVTANFSQKQDRLAELEKHLPGVDEGPPQRRRRRTRLRHRSGSSSLTRPPQEIEDRSVLRTLPPELRRGRATSVGTVVLLTWEMKPNMTNAPKRVRRKGLLRRLPAHAPSTGPRALVTARKTIAGRPGMRNVCRRWTRAAPP